MHLFKHYNHEQEVQREEERRKEDLARQLAEENKRIGQVAQKREAEAQARQAESKRQKEEARRAAIKAQEEEERSKRNLAHTNDWLSIGIQPVVWPTEEKFNPAQITIPRRCTLLSVEVLALVNYHLSTHFGVSPTTPQGLRHSLA